MIKMTLRLPDELHKELARLAEEDRRSLNALIVLLLEESIEETS